MLKLLNIMHNVACHELCVITVDIIDDNHDCELQENSLHGDDEYGDQSDEVQFTEDDVTLLDFDELKSDCEPLEEPYSSPSAENSYITSNPQDGVASDISSGVAQPPIRPKLHSFPVTQFGSKARCFNNKWYEKYSWVEYSIQKDAIFCYPCRFFSLPGTTRTEENFRSIGYRDWKHATGKNGALEKHDKCQSHHQAMLSWIDFQNNSSQEKSVAQRLDRSRSTMIEQNKHYMKTVVEVLLLCARQNIPMRGHDESDSSTNRGNFIEILHTIASHDPVIKERLTGNRSSIYTTPPIQNLLLNILGECVRNIVCEKVKQADAYSVLVDECKDSSKTEQLSFVLRYIDLGSGDICENFLTFVATSCQDAESLCKYILDTLHKHGLDCNKIVSQGYDGASVMSGRYTGVQQRIKAVVPHAIYVHCYAHTLNLVLVDAVKSVQLAVEFFALLESLYIFFSAAKAHTVFLEHQQQLYPDATPMRLQRLSDTRWACRFSSVNVVCSRYDCILASLDSIAYGSDANKAVEARGLYQQIKSFTFLTTLVVFDKVLSITKGLSDELQSQNLDLACAATLVTACQAALEAYRSDEMWGRLFKYISDICKLHEIEIGESMHPRQKRRPPRQLDDSLVYESSGSRGIPECSSQLKTELFFPVIDAFSVELRRRFDDKNIDIMKGIQACHPHSNTFLSFSALKPLADIYSLADSQTLVGELEVARRLFMDKEKFSKTNDVFLRLHSLRDAFPTLSKLVKIAMTIAVSTASCERSFSAMKRIKTYLRSTMGDQRLSDLGILSIERHLSKQVSFDRVLEQFVNKDKNRRIVLS